MVIPVFLFFASTMYAYTPQMNNETTTTHASKERYHSDAIYVMYALFIGLALCFCMVFSVRAYIYCKSFCDEHGFCEKPCCCSQTKPSRNPMYVVETIPIPNDKNIMDYLYDDNIYPNYDNSTSI